MGISALVTALVLYVHALQAQSQTQLHPHPVMPAQGTITSPFGHDGARWHPGIDIGVLRSLTVRAAVSGRVVLVGEVPGYEGYGNVVVVRSRGYQEIYAHLAAWRVRRAVRRPRSAHRDRRLHRVLYRHASPLRGAQERRSGEPVRNAAAPVRSTTDRATAAPARERSDEAATGASPLVRRLAQAPLVDPVHCRPTRAVSSVGRAPDLPN